ncbi:MAG TPA: glycosyl hydrolase [Tepidisphaeraceae bacterium]|jgi:hypothetical protein
MVGWLSLGSRPHWLVAGIIFLCVGAHRASAATGLEQGWDNPPLQAKARTYWWWLNGNVTRESITRDLEGMKARGFGGAVIMDAGGAEQDGNDPVPHGPDFMSPAWRELYKHTLHEADRLGLEISLNIQSGWNLGGPVVKPEDAAKKLTWSETHINGPARFAKPLAEPPKRDGFYRDLFVLAYPVRAGQKDHPPIENWEYKAMDKSLGSSAPDTSVLLKDVPATPGEEDARAADVVDLSPKLAPDGTLTWDVPQGEWGILRFGWTIGDHSYVSTASDGWQGYALDVLDPGAFHRYWDAVVEPLITDAGPMAGKTLKNLHTDSWEVEAINWTPTLREEFEKRRGYDLLPFLPAIAGKIIDDRAKTNRFLFDFRRTLGDLAVAHHYVPFRDGAHRHGMLIHPESGGPHASPIDAQQCLGQDDIPMSEFWAWSPRHRVGDPNRFFVKQPASAAHTYGHPICFAEGFTNIGLHWQESLWDNLKPSFDKALTEGLNVLVWHAFVCSPREMGLPGQQYFAGTHFNPNTTWFEKSGPFIAYINRCQWMLQQGKFVADACCYYGNNVPNFAQLRSSDPAHLGPGYDYDVITADAIIDRLSVRDGRLVLPDGMSYRVLVLPDQRAISLPVLRKVKQLVEAGATILGPRPLEATGLTNYPASDAEVKQLADDLWGIQPLAASRTNNAAAANTPKQIRTVGAGRVVTGLTTRDFLLQDGIHPDFDFSCTSKDADVSYIHRRDGDADIYFDANRATHDETLRCTFRVAGKAPELWDAVSGHHDFASACSESDGRTTVPLELPPCGSMLVVFRTPASAHPSRGERNTPPFTPRQELTGPWTVSFDPKLGGPAQATFDHLESWTARPEPGIRFYSGTATYHRTFDLAPDLRAGTPQLWLDLGGVRELAEVRLNGKSLGVVWSPPFRVDLTPGLKPEGNELEIDVVNFWPNRIIGDASLPPEKRITRTNIRKLTQETPLIESGLLGPVRLMEQGRE